MTDVPTQPKAGDGEKSVTSVNMSGSPVGTMSGDEAKPFDEKVAALAEVVKSEMPLAMSDADATKLGREVESRYLPPPPVPTVLELIEKAKEAAAAPPPPT